MTNSTKALRRTDVVICRPIDLWIAELALMVQSSSIQLRVFAQRRATTSFPQTCYCKPNRKVVHYSSESNKEKREEERSSRERKQSLRDGKKVKDFLVCVVVLFIFS